MNAVGERRQQQTPQRNSEVGVNLKCFQSLKAPSVPDVLHVAFAHLAHQLDHNFAKDWPQYGLFQNVHPNGVKRQEMSKPQ
jgi:hypothetical protein